MNTATTIDMYIAGFPNDIREILEQLRQTVRKTAPDAIETIKYGMPTLTLKENLVHFAAYKHQLGFYPAPSGIDKFRNELAEYKYAKGSVQFPIDKPLPLELITKIVKFRVAENRERAEVKALSKQKKRADQRPITEPRGT